jgi:hypothetical protein
MRSTGVLRHMSSRAMAKVDPLRSMYSKTLCPQIYGGANEVRRMARVRSRAQDSIDNVPTATSKETDMTQLLYSGRKCRRATNCSSQRQPSSTAMLLFGRNTSTGRNDFKNITTWQPIRIWLKYAGFKLRPPDFHLIETTPKASTKSTV